LTKIRNSFFLREKKLDEGGKKLAKERKFFAEEKEQLFNKLDKKLSDYSHKKNI